MVRFIFYSTMLSMKDFDFSLGENVLSLSSLEDGSYKLLKGFSETMSVTGLSIAYIGRFVLPFLKFSSSPSDSSSPRSSGPSSRILMCCLSYGFFFSSS